MPREYVNVKENWTLHDTIIVYYLDERQPPGPLPQGWFNGFAAMAAANDLPFFNVRNRTIGLAYNNQDVRDAFNYAYELQSIGVRFFMASMAQKIFSDQAYKYDHVSAHIFVNDLPAHCSAVLQIEQDERLKTNVAMLPSGHGIAGDGYGVGGVTNGGDPAELANGHHYASTNQGISDMSKRWVWPITIGIPRRANFNVRLQFSEYGKEVLRNLNLGRFPVGFGDFSKAELHCYAGVQVTLKGMRYVQQRGELHA